MFTEYESKPITRLAHKVVESDVIVKVENQESTYHTVIGGTETVFKAYEKINIGDYIIYLNDSDIYHCNASVFADRNIIPE